MPEAPRSARARPGRLQRAQLWRRWRIQTGEIRQACIRVWSYAEACCFQTSGTGQFRPCSGADPHIGRVGDLAHVEEVKIELVCQDALIRDAVAALKKAHPYEEPAYEVWRLEEI